MNYPIFRLTQEQFPHLWNITEPPKQLFVQASKAALKQLDQLPTNGLAVIGTRQPQQRSLVMIDQVLQDLQGTGIVIVSGLALGIDTVAHTCALQRGLPTLAILGSGLDRIYPKENELLSQRILDSGGILVSEFPPGTPPRGFHFLRRNRLVAGWSKATWVVEAGFRSGALNTAKWAREQERMCFAVPCYPGDPAFAGNQTLLDRDHALALWNISSLGAAWLDLATKKLRPASNRKHQDEASPLDPMSQLIKKVESATFASDGASFQDLLNWTDELGLETKDLFETLEIAMQQRKVFHINGLFSVSPR